MDVPVPVWLQQLADKLPEAQLAFGQTPEWFSSVPRHAAVLIVLGAHDDHGKVLLIERAFGEDPHAGQVAFPGGQVDVGDESRVATALREANEETGLQADSVHILGEFPSVWLAPSGFFVTPVIAWWHKPHDLGIQDAQEVRGIHQVPLADLVSPTNRFQVRASNGFTAPAFQIDSLTVWGFTGALLSEVIDLAGWAQPWDETIVRHMPK